MTDDFFNVEAVRARIEAAVSRIPGFDWEAELTGDALAEHARIVFRAAFLRPDADGDRPDE